MARSSTTFTKGAPGNPHGRPPVDPEARAALIAASPRAVAKLVELMDCGDLNVELKAASKIVDKVIGDLNTAKSKDPNSQMTGHARELAATAFAKLSEVVFDEPSPAEH